MILIPVEVLKTASIKLIV